MSLSNYKKFSFENTYKLEITNKTIINGLFSFSISNDDLDKINIGDSFFILGNNNKKYFGKISFYDDNNQVYVSDIFMNTLPSSDYIYLQNYYNDSFSYIKEENTSLTNKETINNDLDIDNIRIINSPNYLNIPTYDGSNQAMHPDVLYFKDGWNGYKYWMAFTPYPSGNHFYENPSVVSSNDGVNWEIPNGLSNPLDFVDNNFNDQKHNSDTELYYEDENLYCIYRQVEIIPSPQQVYERIYMQSSTDGINWGNKTQLFYTSGSNASILSPAIVFFNNMYRIYTVNSQGTTGILQYRESNVITSGYGNFIDCNFDYIPDNKKLWHINITQYNNVFLGIFTFCDSDSSGDNSVLYFAKSTDGVNWTVSKNPILLPSIDSWDNWMIYRSSLVLVDGKFYLYYSASNNSGEWHTGLIILPNLYITNDTEEIGISVDTIDTHNINKFTNFITSDTFDNVKFAFYDDKLSEYTVFDSAENIWKTSSFVNYSIANTYQDVVENIESLPIKNYHLSYVINSDFELNSASISYLKNTVSIKTVKLHGTLVDASGNPVSNTEIVVKINSQSAQGVSIVKYVNSVLTDENGSFSIDLISGVDATLIIREFNLLIPITVEDHDIDITDILNDTNNKYSLY